MSRVLSDLASIVNPISPDDFFSIYWAQKPLLVQRDNSYYYSSLLTSADFEFLLASLPDAQSGWFSIVKECARRPSESMLSEEGSINLPEVYATYKSGCSLLLNQVQKRHKATGLLCRKLEKSFFEAGSTLSRHIGANAYLSPPISKGFSIHYDPHDVFILHLEGYKKWRIYKQGVLFPIVPPEHPISPKEAGRPIMEFVLEPGDLLYIPRGFLHEARTGAESSLHLTLSVETMTWRDLFAEILQMDSQFRMTLPLGFCKEGLSDTNIQEQFIKMVDAITNSVHLRQAASQVKNKIFSNLEPLPGAGFTSLNQARVLKADSWVRLTDGVFGRVETGEVTTILHLPGACFGGGLNMDKSFRFMLRTPVFRPRDLPVKAPVIEKMSFVRNLVLSGYLELAANPEQF